MYDEFNVPNWYIRRPIWELWQSNIAQFVQKIFSYWYINVANLKPNIYVVNIERDLKVWDKAVIYADNIPIGWGKIDEKTFILLSYKNETNND